MQKFGKLVKFFQFCCELNEQSSLCTCEFKQNRTMRGKFHCCSSGKKMKEPIHYLEAMELKLTRANGYKGATLGKLKMREKNTKFNVLSNLL